MAVMNARLAPKLETVFLMASDKSQFISSRFIKEISKLGGDVSAFVSHMCINNLSNNTESKQCVKFHTF